MDKVKAKVSATASVELIVMLKRNSYNEIDLEEVLEVLDVDDIDDIEIISEF